MPSIWLTGPSGTGKSTFALELSKVTKLPVREEGPRIAGDILKTSFANREVFYVLSYVNRHLLSLNGLESFISDRTLLDAVFWTYYNGEKYYDTKGLSNYVDLVKPYINPNDMYILAPAPSQKQFYRTSKVFQNFFKDKFRTFAYTGKFLDVNGYPPPNESEFLKFIFEMMYKMSMDIFILLQNCLENDLFYKRTIIPEHIDESINTGDDFFKWKTVALKALKRSEWYKDVFKK